MRRIGIELRAVGAGKAADVARELDGGELHAQADAEVGNPVLARMADRRDLALDAALAEAAGHQDRIHLVEATDAVLLDAFRVDVMDVEPGTGMDARVDQRFRQ